MNFKQIAILLFSFSILISCTESNDDSDNGSSDSFDRKALLENAADNIIIPALQDLNSDLIKLKASKDLFITTPNQANLDNLRSDWLIAYKTWQYVEMFNIGKAEEILYNFQMNIYPTNTTDIQNNIASGNYDLTSPNNNDAVGFPALDYLLYGLSSDDSTIIDFYSTNTNAVGYANYLSDVINQMEALTNLVLTDWTSSYRDIFVNSTANTASSSVNMLVNDFIFYYEKGLRANKIGIPAGVFSTTPLADKVEGFYSEIYSKDLALIALKAAQDFFNGKAYQSTITGVSYASYVTTLRTNSGSSDLTASINNQIEAARTELNQLDNNLFNQVNSNNTAMLMTYDELQRVTVLLKVDMLQTLNISVDYVDADGD
ncbi:imelysin family protein [Nonlabens mediterrranea]|uniref:Imelysin family protein n=1 Tax=Nonlabens mediterrranea TaxID=1419947 RepID=A0ABS0A1D9_9FLAO|nr:imelysin family protein [Nonlabens mediterrranea]